MPGWIKLAIGIVAGAFVFLWVIPQVINLVIKGAGNTINSAFSSLLTVLFTPVNLLLKAFGQPTLNFTGTTSTSGPGPSAISTGVGGTSVIPGGAPSTTATSTGGSNPGTNQPPATTSTPTSGAIISNPSAVGRTIANTVVAPLNTALRMIGLRTIRF